MFCYFPLFLVVFFIWPGSPILLRPSSMEVPAFLGMWMKMGTGFSSFIYIYIYIYIEKERERDTHYVYTIYVTLCVCMSLSLYIYIYMYICIHMCIYIYVGMWMKIGTGVFSFVASYVCLCFANPHSARLHFVFLIFVIQRTANAAKCFGHLTELPLY